MIPAYLEYLGWNVRCIKIVVPNNSFVGGRMIYSIAPWKDMVNSLRTSIILTGAAEHCEGQEQDVYANSTASKHAESASSREIHIIIFQHSEVPSRYPPILPLDLCLFAVAQT